MLEPGADGIAPEPKWAASKPAFEICGKDKKYGPANVALVDGIIILTSPDVPTFEYGRYGWEEWFTPALFNAVDLPASPFRTDKFRLRTARNFYLNKLNRREKSE
jgi:hypothetical protein